MECGPIRRRSRLGHAFFPGRPRGRELVYYFEAGDTVLPLMAISFHTLRAVPVFIVPRYPPLVTSLLERVLLLLFHPTANESIRYSINETLSPLSRA